MDPDRERGKMQRVGGIIKQATGIAAGDESMRQEGAVDEAAGRADEATGLARDGARVGGAGAGGVTRQTTTTTTTTTSQNPPVPPL